MKGKILKVATIAGQYKYYKIYVFVETPNGHMNVRYRYYNEKYEGETEPGIPMIEPVFFEYKDAAESERSIDEMIQKTIKEVEGMSDSITSQKIEDLVWEGIESIN